MIVTTTNEIQGRRIKNYIGLVCGTSMITTNFMEDLEDDMPYVPSSVESYWGESHNNARSKMEQEAGMLGAEAVVGVDIKYESVRHGCTDMLMITVFGTAVNLY